MGMFLNRFHMLKQLREYIKHKSTDNKDLNNLVLSGIIVHDHNDENLVKCVSNNFVEWAERTGKHFLFITFIHPSEDWKKNHNSDSYVIDTDKLMTDSSFSEEDEKSTIPQLRNFLGLPKNGSFLMLTDNLCSNTFYQIPISAETIEEQFIQITKYCYEKAAGAKNTPGDFQQLLNTLNLNTLNKYSEISIDKWIIDVIIDFESLISPFIEHSFPSFLSENANTEQLNHANDVIKKVRDVLHNYIGEDFEDKVFNLYECIAYSNRLKSENENDLITSHRPHMAYEYGNGCYGFLTTYSKYSMPPFSYLDEYSILLYQSYKSITSVLSKIPDKLDYSGLTIYLGKIVENELNLSLGQMLRWAMNIDMPTYYNKYCAGRGNIFVAAGNSRAYLNQRLTENGTQLKSIPIGTLLWAYRSIPENHVLMQDRITKLNEHLLAFLQNFSDNYRNPAGHIDNNSEITYKGAQQAFDEFLNHYLYQLDKIKIALLTAGINHQNHA